MNEERIFVGRKKELQEFRKVLERPIGEAVMVVGQKGRGKTWLVDRMAEIAEEKLGDKCLALRYQVVPTDPVNIVMNEIMNDAADAIDSVRNKARKFVDRNKQKLAALFGVGGLIPIVGNRIKAAGDLVISLTERDKAGNVRKQFIEVLGKLSKCMPKEARVIIIVDPNKYLQEKSDYAWGVVVEKLPEKIKLVFAQRSDGVLSNGEGFKGLDNVVHIPEGELSKFDEQTIDELVEAGVRERPELAKQIREGLSRSDGTAYASTGTMELITLAGMTPDDFAEYMTLDDVVKVQWQMICESGDKAQRLFKAYAILGVGVPDEVVENVSGLSAVQRKRLEKDKYLRRLLREEGAGKQIYHAILTDYILEQIGDDERQRYHERAVEVYRGKLAKAKKAQIKPDELAAMRLAEHVLAAEGQDAFVDAFVNECTQALANLGLLDAVISISERALKIVKKGSEEQAVVLGNLGLIYQTRGELDKAEQMYNKVLKIEEKLGRPDSIAKTYGNLGNIYQTRGELDKAEKMYDKVLKIEEKLGRPDSIANTYGNLGVVYRKRGELDKAEQMYLKSLEISEKGGMVELSANQYGNLGTIYRRRGELDKAEQMHKKSLEIEKKLGLLEGMASEYGNLGAIYEERGDIKRAREYWEKAVELFKKIGMPHMVEKVQGWIEGLSN